LRASRASVGSDPEVPHENFTRRFQGKLERKNIFKQTTGNENLHKIINDNCVRAVNFVTSKESNLPGAQCSQIATYINTFGILLMAKDTTYLSQFYNKKQHSNSLSPIV
jgi:hypothetical protein